MTAVPRLYEVMHQRIQRGLLKATPFQRKMFDLAYTLGRKNYEHPGTPHLQGARARTSSATCWCGARSASGSAGG